jgi:hypothetical protein
MGAYSWMNIILEGFSYENEKDNNHTLVAI